MSVHHSFHGKILQILHCILSNYAAHVSKIDESLHLIVASLKYDIICYINLLLNKSITKFIDHLMCDRCFTNICFWFLCVILYDVFFIVYSLYSLFYSLAVKVFAAFICEINYI